jgi:hypothetical protein
MRKYFRLLDNAKEDIQQSDVGFFIWFFIMMFCIMLCLSIMFRWHRRRRMLEAQQRMQGQYAAYPQAQYQAYPAQPAAHPSGQQYYAPPPSQGQNQQFVPFQSTGYRLGTNEPVANSQPQYMPPPPPHYN